MDTRIEQIDDEQCRSFLASVELVGRRWSSGILLAMARGATRFSEVVEAVPGLSDRMLAQRVRELESAELIERLVRATTPVQVRYRLTPRGLDLIRSLQPLAAWAQRWNIDGDGAGAGDTVGARARARARDTIGTTVGPTAGLEVEAAS